ncbi:MAG: hypothetical protein KGJ73_11950 [Rhodospirillales bacterium]|nr:hypothetical protein [Rhodospirillales bacterium]
MNGNKFLGWGLPLLVAVVPFAAFFTLGLRYFYINGAWWGDGGILASLMWHSGWWLKTPLVSGGQSYLATHIVPVFWLTSGLSLLLPLTRVQFFAVFLGAVQGLMALPVYVLLARLGLARPWAAALAVLFAFNGMVLAASCNPHFELLIIATGMAFLAAFSCGRVWLARLFFVLCLITREDAGFHLGLLLFAGGLGLYWQGVDRERLRPLFGYAAAAFCWSVAAVAVQHVAFPGGEALTRVYLGKPPFADLTLIVLATRLEFYLVYRLYLVLPLAVTLILARRCRVPGLLAGFAACLPWLGLNWLAVSPIAGTLSNYYPFPMIFGLFWPLANQAMAKQLGARKALNDRQAVLVFAVALLSSFVGLWGLQNPQNLRFPEEFFGMLSVTRQQATEQAMVGFRQAELGRVVVDGSVIALDPNHFRRSQWVLTRQTVLPNTVIFFPHGPGTKPCLRLAKQAGLTQYYEVPGTALRIATDKALNLKALNLTPWTPPQ